MMRRHLLLLGVLCTAALTIAAIWTGAQEQDPCALIISSCQAAGFVAGGAKFGNGLMVDCIQPIMQGKADARASTKPLPAIDASVTAACKAKNPNFGLPAGGGRPAKAAQPAASSASAPSSAAGAASQQPTPRSGPADEAPTANVALPPSAAPRSGARPNIVFILTDDLSLNLVQFMPHVLEMQKRGVTFTNYFVTDSLCCPSRSSIFTGRYPHDTGIFRNQGLDGGYLGFHDRGNDLTTFAVALTEAGYRAALLGKYLNGYEPVQHPPAPGWSRWAVAGNGYGGFRYALNEDGKVVRYGSEPKDYLTDVVSEKAQRFIKEKSNAPFFIEIATFAPHAPYTPAPRDANAFPGLTAPRTPAYDAPPGSDAPTWLKSHPALSPMDMAAIDRDFRKRAQSVLAVDKMIGDLEAAVVAISQQNNTYFVFSSDNGYHMGEHRLMPGKMTAFDTDIHVPLVITGPGVPPGRTVEAVTENIDLAPTFEDLAGARIGANVDGVSLAALLLGQKVDEWGSVALVEHHGPMRERPDPDLPAVRSGNPTTYEAIRARDWVYVEYANGEREFHDRTSDPDELRNTYSSLSRERKASLAAIVSAVQNCHNARSCWAAAHPEPLAH